MLILNFSDEEGFELSDISTMLLFLGRVNGEILTITEYTQGPVIIHDGKLYDVLYGDDLMALPPLYYMSIGLAEQRGWRRKFQKAFTCAGIRQES